MMKLKHLLEYLFYLKVAFILRTLPLGAAYWLAARFGDFIFALGTRKQVTIDNLRQVFGDTKTDRELEKSARNVYRNFSMTACEVLRLRGYSIQEISGRVIFDGLEHLDNAYRKGRGTVLVTGHLGCWDIMGFAILEKGYPMTYVSGGFRNQRIDDLYNRFREEKGIPVLPRRYALRGAVKALKQNRFLGIVSDQNAGDNGAFVDFFGRKASTPKGAALFALRTGAEMVVVLDAPEPGTKRVKHRAYIRPVVIEKTGNEDKDVFLYTQEFTRIIEEIIRKHPEDYFWLHRRWKTRPPMPGR